MTTHSFKTYFDKSNFYLVYISGIIIFFFQQIINTYIVLIYWYVEFLSYKKVLKAYNDITTSCV